MSLWGMGFQAKILCQRSLLIAISLPSLVFDQLELVEARLVIEHFPTPFVHSASFLVERIVQHRSRKLLIFTGGNSSLQV